MDQKTFIPDDKERDCGCPESPQTYKRNAKTINLAIQGGGAHGAYDHPFLFIKYEIKGLDTADFSADSEAPGAAHT